MKRRFTLILLVLVLLSFTAHAEVPEYLNPDGTYPVVQEGTNVSLDIMQGQNASQGNADELWWWHYVENEMGIQVNVEQSMDPATWKSLAFASGDYPEVLIGMGLSTAELMRYGAEEGQIIPLNDYITPEIMPNLTAIFEVHPEYKATLTAPDGNIYTLCGITYPNNPASTYFSFINSAWLEKVDKDMPVTLDELIDVLRAFKTLGDDVIPLGGSNDAHNPLGYILNAYGYLTKDSKGMSIALRDGKPVIPAGDRELFGEVLKTFRMLYEEGLISPDFYTMDDTASAAMFSEGKAGVGNINLHSYLADSNWNEWVSVIPLTSQYNTTQQWPSSQTLQVGAFALTDVCQEPELACKMIDALYDPSGFVLAFYGPMTHMTDYLYDINGDGAADFKGYYYDIDENTDTKTLGIGSVEIYLDVAEDQNDTYANAAEYRTKRIRPVAGTTALGNNADVLMGLARNGGFEERGYRSFYDYDLSTSDGYMRAQIYQSCLPYAKDSFPYITFFTEEQTTEMNDLWMPIKDYMATTIAEFVTGARPLDELDAYFDTLDSMGFSEYLAYYQAYYDAYLASMPD